MDAFKKLSLVSNVFNDCDLGTLEPEEKDFLFGWMRDYLLYQKSYIIKLEKLLIEYHIDFEECGKKWKG